MPEGTIPSEKLSSMARTVLGTTLGLKRGQTVLIEAWTNSLPYAEAFQLEARRMGIKPLILYDSEAGYWEAVEDGVSKGMGDLSKSEWEALKAADGYVYFWGPSDQDRLRVLPPRVQKQLTAYNGRWYELTAKAGVRAVRMELALAEPRAAEAMGVDLLAWRTELSDGGAADPKKMQQIGQRIAGRLKSGGTLRITHENGTDLTLKIPKGRKVVVDDGIIDASDIKAKNNVGNVPAGSVVVSVDEGAGDGYVKATRPARYLRGRKQAQGVSWEFKAGRLVSRSSTAGGTDYEEYFAKGAKGKDRPALFEIGLNPALKDAPNFEDQRLGTVSVYVGGNQFYGGKSKSDFLAYLMLEGANVELDGKLLLRGGIPQ